MDPLLGTHDASCCSVPYSHDGCQHSNMQRASRLACCITSQAARCLHQPHPSPCGATHHQPLALQEACSVEGVLHHGDDLVQLRGAVHGRRPLRQAGAGRCCGRSRGDSSASRQLRCSAGAGPQGLLCLGVPAVGGRRRRLVRSTSPCVAQPPCTHVTTCPPREPRCSAQQADVAGTCQGQRLDGMKDRQIAQALAPRNVASNGVLCCGSLTRPACPAPPQTRSCPFCAQCGPCARHLLAARNGVCCCRGIAGCPCCGAGARHLATCCHLNGLRSLLRKERCHLPIVVVLLGPASGGSTEEDDKRGRAGCAMTAAAAWLSHPATSTVGRAAMAISMMQRDKASYVAPAKRLVPVAETQPSLMMPP
jgi:hypothetical protein